jgi:hypothetical protein
MTSPLRAVASAAGLVQDWAHGTEGRRRTRRALRPLEQCGWRVDHDITLPGGIYADHLALGPCGVYVIDSRAWGGVVTVDHKGPTITPRGDPRAAWTANGHHRSLPPVAAAVVRSLAAAGLPVRAPRAVVAIWAPFPDRIAESGGVTYIAGAYLADWLAGQPTRLGVDEVAALTGAATAALVPTQRPPVPA